MILVAKRYNGNSMKYEFIKGKDICYYGRLLSPTQINYLKKYGNTCINEEILASLGEKQLISEIEELTGLQVMLDLYESEFDGTSVIIRAVGNYPLVLAPAIVIDRRKFKKYFVLYKDGKEFMKISKEQMTLNELKELLKMNGVVDYEIM